MINKNRVDQLLQKFHGLSPVYKKSESQINKSEYCIVNKSSRLQSMNSLIVPTTLPKQQEDSNCYIISLSSYETRKFPQNNEAKHQSQCLSQSSFDSQRQKTKRDFIYGNESFKELPEDFDEFPCEANNQIFQLVFLNKKKQYHDSVSTAGSFSKVKTSKQKENPSITIDDFQLGKKLGSGRFGSVFIAKHKKTGFLCAVKKISKFDIDKKVLIQLIREIKIQSFLNHPNICKLYTFFCDWQYIYLVLELCYSGQLFNYLKTKRKLSQTLTKSIIQQALKALDYMHDNEIIHRDLKPENIIFHNSMIKLCDFGWSISSNKMRQTFCGTPLYASPQILKHNNYNNKIDVWSIGILTYQLLFGRVPFDITTERDFIKIVEDQIKFSKATKISEAAKEFILICLKKDPRERHTVHELLEHPFIESLEPVSTADMF